MDIWNLGYPVSYVTPRQALTFYKPSAIMAVFLFIGSAVLLYIKAIFPPGPLLFATIFGCIAIGKYEGLLGGRFQPQTHSYVADVIITTAVLFPFPYYDVGTLCHREIRVLISEDW